MCFCFQEDYYSKVSKGYRTLYQMCVNLINYNELFLIVQVRTKQTLHHLWLKFHSISYPSFPTSTLSHPLHCISLVTMSQIKSALPSLFCALLCCLAILSPHEAWVWADSVSDSSSSLLETITHSTR